MWINEWEQSSWAFWRCYLGDDTPEMRKLITSPEWLYSYCKFVRNDTNIKNRISPEEYKRIKECDHNISIHNDAIGEPYIMGLWKDMSYAWLNNFKIKNDWEQEFVNKMAEEVSKDIDQEIINSLKNKKQIKHEEADYFNFCDCCKCLHCTILCIQTLYNYLSLCRRAE